MSLNENRSDHAVPAWMPVVMFIALIVALFLFQIIVGVVVAVSGHPDFGGFMVSPPGLVVQVVFMAIVLISVSLGGPALFGVGPTTFVRLCPARAPVFAAAMLGVVGLGFLVDEVTFLLHGLDPERFDASGLELFNTIFVQAQPAWFVVLPVVVSLGPGFGEELFFRGFALRSFLPRMPAWIAVLLTSLMFGLIHFDPLQSPGAGLIGLYLGFVAVFAGSLWPAMAAHALNNFICALFARYGGAEVSRVWETGHPPWILAAATLLTAVSIAALVRTRAAR